MPSPRISVCMVRKFFFFFFFSCQNQENQTFLKTNFQFAHYVANEHFTTAKVKICTAIQDKAKKKNNNIIQSIKIKPIPKIISSCVITVTP